MAKTLGPKSQLIRQAITANANMGNTELAQLLNDANERRGDKIKVTAQDIAQQKQQMKKAGTLPTGKKRGRPAGKPVRAAAQPAVAAPAGGVIIDNALVADHVAAIKRAVEGLGRDQVKKLADLFG